MNFKQVNLKIEATHGTIKLKCHGCFRNLRFKNKNQIREKMRLFFEKKRDNLFSFCICSRVKSKLL